MGGVKADGWIYKWESCLSESGKKALSSARSFSHFQFFFYKTLYIFEKELLPLEEIWTTLF